jgi:hypothetical protein
MSVVLFAFGFLLLLLGFLLGLFFNFLLLKCLFFLLNNPSDLQFESNCLLRLDPTIMQHPNYIIMLGGK